MEKIDYNNGIRFKCQGSANCCVSRGEYGFVYLSNRDIKRLSLFTKLKKMILSIFIPIKLMNLRI